MRSCTLAFHSTFETIKSLLHLASVSTCPSLVSTLAVNLAALLAPCLHQGSPRVVSQSATRHSHLRTLCSVDPSAATGTLHHVGFGSIVAVLPARNNGPPPRTGNGSNFMATTVELDSASKTLCLPFRLLLRFFLSLFLCLTAA